MIDNNNPSSNEQDDDHDNDDNPEQIRITLSLSPTINDPTLSIPLTDSIAVPSTIRRKGLSAVVNHLLERHVVSDSDDSDSDDETNNDDNDNNNNKLPALSFDFVIRDKLLRTDLRNFSRREGLSTEEALPVYYFPARNVPEGGGQSDVYPDWISSLSYNEQGLLCSGGYDGMIRLFDDKQTSDDDDDDVCRETKTIHAGQGPIKSLSSLSSCSNKMTLIATGSMDQTLVSHVYDDETKTLRLHAQYRNGHYDSIDAVSLFGKKDGDATMMASGDWSGGLCLWTVPSLSLNDDDNDGPDDVIPEKKRRTNTTTTNNNSSNTTVQTIQPLSSIKAHTQSISSLAWNNDGSKLFSGSFDYGLKVWDVSRSDCLLTLNGSRVISCMGRSRCVNSAEDVVATGHPDGTVRLWDMRVGKTSNSNKDDNGGGGRKISERSFQPSHKAWVAAIEWSTLDPYVLATNSYDGCLKLWDIRSSLPLHSVRVHKKGDKGLCLAMAARQKKGRDNNLMSADVIFTGGSDGIVKRFVC